MRKASKMWRSKLQKNYRNFAEWESYSELYGLAKRIGFASAQEAWDVNPTIQGSTNPADFRIVKPKTPKSNKRILSVTIKRMYDDSPDTSWLGKYGSRAESKYAIDRRHSEDCIENNQSIKDKLERIASWIENDRPICEEHTQFVEENCEVCREEKAYTQALEQVQELAECEGCAYHDRNTFEYFNPDHENYKGEPEEEIRKYCRQDYDRMESLNNGNFCFIGIRAEARIALIPEITKEHGYAEQKAIHNGFTLNQVITSGGLWGIESDSDKSYLESVEKDELANLRTQLKALGFSTRAISTAFKNIERKNQ